MSPTTSSITSARNAAIAGRADYAASLEAAWAAHLAPRTPDAPTVISLFAGGGGSSLGYSTAGLRELLAVEWDPVAAATFRTNFPDVPLLVADITALPVGRVLGLAGIGPGMLDVLDGSPPCQGFSTNGARRLADPRNDLFREYVRLLEGLRPRCFVMENVSGMVKGRMKLVFAEVLRALRGAGYRVRARLLDAQYFGVPQMRQRLIFLGIRTDLDREPTHPAATGPPIPCGVIRPFDAPVVAHSRRLAGFWDRLAIGQSGHQFPGRAGKDFSITKVDPRRPCPTIIKTWTSGCGLLHWGERRLLSVPELAQIAGYGLEFRFAGNAVDAVARIGNSVPPPFMRAIARHLRAEVLGCPDPWDATTAGGRHASIASAAGSSSAPATGSTASGPITPAAGSIRTAMRSS